MTYPLVTLSTRAQVDAKGEHRSFTVALKKILDKEGVPGLYSGLKSALFGIGITNGKSPSEVGVEFDFRDLLFLV